MPRKARIKILGGIYHIIIRGINEIKLFKGGKEKETYLKYMKKYQDIFQFNVYGFCMMNTHAHFIIGSNGADISKFMHSVNGCYVKYYNKKHDRHGHALSERFKSILITNDTYLMNASLYVHRNPKDMQEYKNKMDEYKYSSLSQYIKNLSNEIPFIPVDTSLILMQISNDNNKARSLYYQMVMNKELPCNCDKKNPDLIKETYEYISGKKYMCRNINPVVIIEYVSKYLNIKKEDINIKYKKEPAQFRALSILLMRCFCDMEINKICTYIGNITSSQTSFLCNKGYKLAKGKKEYADLFSNFINEFYA